MRINLTAFSLAIAAWVILLAGAALVRGNFVCNPNCVSKLASGAALAVHLIPQAVTIAKGKKTKTTKAKRT